ncbi:protein sidekick-2-like [Porites lutea]|uniref:protein sidekick-2-like n=1 Tax=Porites lutea TaxID=51062 RepID=UPI003CC5423A
MILLNLADDYEQEFNLSKNVRNKELAVQSNTAYELQIRAKNSMGFSLWTREKWTTTTDVPEMMEFSAKPEGCFAALSWRNPSQTNCPITRYTVHFRETATISNGKTKWQTKNLGKQNKTEYRLKLNCSRTYEVMVIAWNERGSSIPDENMVTVRTETGVPFQPKWIEIVEKQCGKFKVTWFPDTLDSGGGPTSGFQVRVREHTGQWFNCTNFLSNNSCLLKDLQSETEYDIQVRAINQKGPGEWAVKTKPTSLIGKCTHLESLNAELQLNR